jgi:uncharacterized membrane protein (DUF485 family)
MIRKMAVLSERGAGMTGRKNDLYSTAKARWRVAISLSMLTIYVTFILLVGFERPLLARVVVPGLTLAILLGVFIIATSCVLTWIYVSWANWRQDEEAAGPRE